VTQDVIVTGNVSATGYTGTSASLAGNVSGSNILTGGQVSAVGNITGGYILGNGSQLTGLPANYGNSNVTTLLAGFGSNTISTTGTINSGNITGGNISATNHTGTTVSVTGTITGGNLSVGTGTITGGNIVNSNANGVGNIGSASTYFNTVFAQATSAQYADLAENYLADAEYAPGTVVVFGGDQEITVTTEHADERVAGVISTNPAYLMNSGLDGAAVALRGRVPVRVVGAVTKGDGLVTAATSGVACSIGRSRDYAQAVFAKALETSTDTDEKIIQAVIL
jgi:hypothetical protein